jgi:hypothetical protein
VGFGRLELWFLVRRMHVWLFFWSWPVVLDHRAF